MYLANKFLYTSSKIASQKNQASQSSVAVTLFLPKGTNIKTLKQPQSGNQGLCIKLSPPTLRISTIPTLPTLPPWLNWSPLPLSFPPVPPMTPSRHSVVKLPLALQSLLQSLQPIYWHRFVITLKFHCLAPLRLFIAALEISSSLFNIIPIPVTTRPQPKNFPLLPPPLVPLLANPPPSTWGYMSSSFQHLTFCVFCVRNGILWSVQVGHAWSYQSWQSWKEQELQWMSWELVMDYCWVVWWYAGYHRHQSDIYVEVLWEQWNHFDKPIHSLF